MWLTPIDDFPRVRESPPPVANGSCQSASVNVYLAGGGGYYNERHKRMSEEIRRCLFCGKEVKKPNMNFCDHCRLEGFDNVYNLNGKSNGWDRVKKKKPVPIVSGWRGVRPGGNMGAKGFSA